MRILDKIDHKNTWKFFKFNNYLQVFIKSLFFKNFIIGKSISPKDLSIIPITNIKQYEKKKKFEDLNQNHFWLTR